MPLKLAMIVLPPLCVTCVVLYLAGVPWTTTAQVAAALLVFVAVIGLCDRLRQRRSPWQQQPGAESMADAPQQEAVLGIGASAIASLPVYKYRKKRGGTGDECSVCLAEVKLKETVKKLPACTHLFHEGCIDVWLRSHRTCPVCRTPVNAAAAATPTSLEVVVHTQAN
ncbi:RING-H2 finger protein ATL32-like [Panicum miliaceum]|uniref:RING-type E3 ubiquitin transferase n=1 Tax=Panicum miliaceum TaxID=4540 RepID=A0A3L6PFS3_PANMI|nr:RING-H2 finger protein ATL32-like [Panicum miliaceum]